mmetsp:Transcript_9294/g.23431  ORF Transcript_9294/g.23431 Transcript_9294/m.23431 type:complete len:101 (-) Transcript_9294:3-305(-)
MDGSFDRYRCHSLLMIKRHHHQNQIPNKGNALPATIDPKTMPPTVAFDRNRSPRLCGSTTVLGDCGVFTSFLFPLSSGDNGGGGGGGGGVNCAVWICQSK